MIFHIALLFLANQLSTKYKDNVLSSRVDLLDMIANDVNDCLQILISQLFIYGRIVFTEFVVVPSVFFLIDLANDRLRIYHLCVNTD
jgi:hypothetical protein